MGKIREQLADFFSGGEYSRVRTEAGFAATGERHFRERLAELEANVAGLIDQRGWQELGADDDHDFSLTARRDSNRLSQLMWLKNPLIRRAVEVQVDYVFALGVTVQTQDDAANEALRAFWYDARNLAEFTGEQALQDAERNLQLTGELFCAFWVNRLTGHTHIRTFDPGEITEFISNPDDKAEVWFYKREWTKRTVKEDGSVVLETMTRLYPDINYRPARKPTTYAKTLVEWETPVFYVATGRAGRMVRGTCELLPARDWARAYSKFLQARFSVADTLSRIVLLAKHKLKSAADKLRGAASSRTPYGGNAGGTAATDDSGSLEAINVKGATIDPDEGRRFQLMVASASGLPETFFGDANVGNHATAQTLDRPTELKMENRRSLWVSILTTISVFVLRQAIGAPGNALGGTIAQPEYSATPHASGIALKNGEMLQIDVTFPPLLEHDASTRMDAVEKAAKYVPNPRLMARLSLQALGEKNIDDKVKDLPEVGFLSTQPEPLAQSDNTNNTANADIKADNNA